MKLALGIASALVVCAAACKKDEKKTEEPAPAREPKPAPPTPEATAALSGFRAAAEAAPPKSGQIAGLGGKLGDLFAGAAASATELPPPAARGGDCDSVADRLMLVMKAYVEAKLASLPAEDRAAAKGMIDGELAGMRPQLLAMCTGEKWSQELRDCALTAASIDAFDACGQFAPAGSALAAEDPATPAPAWTGGDSCKDVGLRLTQLAAVSMGGLDPAMKSEMERALAESAKQTEEACTTGNWNAEVRTCMVAAATIDDVTPCFEKLGI